MQAKKVWHGHKNDIHWGGATVCWCNRRGGWVLPGGEVTKLEREALLAAKSLSGLIPVKPVFIRKIAA